MSMCLPVLALSAVAVLGNYAAAQRTVGGNAALVQQTAGGRAAACQCVPFHQCEVDNIDSGANGSPSSECSGILEVCCFNPNSAITPSPGPDAPHVARCGRRNQQGVDVRVSGLGITQAQFGEFPWMAAIVKSEFVGAEEVNLYVCGGSLIRPGVVLTAAHCVLSSVDNPRSLKIRLGEWDTQQKNELYTHVDRRVVQVIIHEKFDSQFISNDYALLILESPVNLAPHIDTICLPDRNTLIDGNACVVTGWGKDKFGKPGQFQNILKKITLSMVPNNFCQDALRTTRLGKFFTLHSSFNCAGGDFDGQDACNGDGGSPLVCPLVSDRSTFVQVGMVAWGIGCGQPGIPGVYANVVEGSDWIKRRI